MNDIADLLQPLIAFRRDIHAHPELGFAEHRTAQRIAEQLRAIGLEVHEGIGGTGIVAVLRSGDGKRTLGLRADMDALPIEEHTNAAWSSTVPGCFHGCGHDGHVAMLLGAAQVLARDPGFSGTLNFIFQPAEEGLGGARHMIEDGLFERFDCERVYALHNWPGLPAGTIATRPGAIMGAADKFKIVLEGKGGHAALPQDTPDTILAAASLVQQLNSIIGRDIPPSANAVLSVTEIAGGHAHNVLPASVRIGGTVRSFDPVVQDRIEERMRQMIKGIETSFEVRSSLEYDRYYPATINDADAAGDALDVAATVASAQLAPEPAPTSEDFSFMLQERPGAYLWLGQGRGDNPPPLHNPHYDFNDDVMETGIRLHVALARHWLQD
ncbi:M20 aminoacylase family protein [Novosphingobium pentaromativorans]|uniref:Hippurate hydrolase n=1 Tax=Novosphingobium pentaromativorans US6-1 TaxID=1088721 RepID=G6EFZ1_9SPHN|nr:M20 aminoacylase family protein [Novosphingobium pentaromativorans]AIT82310.1 peptidase M20 [Novosphingobium pentaromativorans US6-1]EHJ59680.1 hippurate hydrolase [Novosphingobium pentaromativorans US6-1]